MKQLTRDLCVSGRVWLSLSHSFTQNTNSGGEIDLVKVNGDFVTLNAGALYILTLWGSSRTPEKFYMPEYKIYEFKSILEQMMELKNDKEFVLNNELTAKGKPDSLFYRLTLSNKKFIDVFFVEIDINGDKAVNLAIKLEDNIYTMFDSNVYEIIDTIPTPGELSRFKQDAAQLYYLSMLLGKASSKGSSSYKSGGYKSDYSHDSYNYEPKSEPRTITKVDRSGHRKVEDRVSRNQEPYNVQPSDFNDKPIKSTSGVNYNDLLGDE